MENYIQWIDVKDTHFLKQFVLPLSQETRKHLILTGKNGSGKTSLMNEINRFLTVLQDSQMTDILKQEEKLEHLKKELANPNLNDYVRSQIKSNFDREKSQRLPGSDQKLDIQFSTSTREVHEKSLTGQFLLAFFDAKRHMNLDIPQGIQKFDLQKKYPLREKANKRFLQYIVNLKADRSFAREDKDVETVKKIDDWFSTFTNRLREILGYSELHLAFNRTTYSFEIKVNNSAPVSFNTLSDGYSSIIGIITEIILRMESHDIKSYDLEGIVLIDEIETHLHVDLQKKILPFLTDFFPKIQFIVSTHSPFVLSSIENSVIFDLEKRIVTSDFSGYSYDAIIESYFGSNNYSIELINKIDLYENLLAKNDLTVDEYEEKVHLANYLNSIPAFLSAELAVKLQQLRLADKKPKLQ